jgi:hypothetical protein
MWLMQVLELLFAVSQCTKAQHVVREEHEH